MNTPTEDAILKMIEAYLLNKSVPTKTYGKAARYIENELEKLGLPYNKGAGCDLPFLGWEVKSRDTTSTSAITIASMNPNKIITTPYYVSPVFIKCQKILMFITEDCKIKDIELYDFSVEYIQSKIADAYEHGRKQIISDPKIAYTEYTGKYGYFEKTKKDRPELDFRLSHYDLINVKKMSNPLTETLFSWN